MAGKSYVDSVKFNQAMTGLQKTLGKPLREVIRAETGSILKTCCARTKVTKPEKAEMRARNKVTRSLGFSGYSGSGATKASKSDHPITINSGRRGPTGRVFVLKNDGSGFRRTHNEGFSPIFRHYKNTTWNLLQEAILDVKSGWARAVPAGLKSIGLARQSWVQIARSVGIDLKRVPGGSISAAGIEKAERALASDGQSYINGGASDISTNSSYVISLVNRLPWCRRGRLDGILVSAMNGRANYFAQNLKRGVFDSVKNTLRAYPGFKVAA
jgi:hypothetical protein